MKSKPRPQSDQRRNLGRFVALVASVAMVLPSQTVWLAPAAVAAGMCPSGSTSVGSGRCQVTFNASTNWTIPNDVSSVDVVAVGGGGGGGSNRDPRSSLPGAGGGGGGGQVTQATYQAVTPGASATITVGAGGAGGLSGVDGTAGGTSSFVIGGVRASAAGGLPGTGGSWHEGYYITNTGYGGASGAGYAGGSPNLTVGGNPPSWASYFGGGGGGSSAAGVTAGEITGGNGGAGTVPSDGLFAGYTTAYAGGGGGGSQSTGGYTTSPGHGVAGGGDGNGSTILPGEAATANTGGGGGGTGSFTAGAGGNGGTGLVIVRFLAPGGGWSQTISFTSQAPSNAAYGGTYTPTASATSGLAVTFTIDSTAHSICSISGGVVTFTGVGTCTVNANQSGSGTTYDPAPQVQQSFSVGKASQMVGWTSAPPAHPVVGGTWAATGFSSSGLPVTFVVDSGSSSVCSVGAGNIVTFNAAGYCAIRVTQAGNAYYLPATPVLQSFNVGAGKQNQTISFSSSAPTDAMVGGPAYTPVASATSDLTVTLTIDASASSVCSIDGGVVSFDAAGTCVIDANQAGNASYNPAPQVQQTFTVAAAGPGYTATGTDVVVTPAVAEGSSPVTVTFGTVTSAGTTSLTTDTTPPAPVPAGYQTGATFFSLETTASYSGSITVCFSYAEMTPAPTNLLHYETDSWVDVTDSIDTTDNVICGAAESLSAFALVTLLQGQTITFSSTEPANAVVGGPTYTPAATGGGSGNPVVFTIDATASSVCTIDSGVVSFVTAGTCIIDADQAGDGTYSAAPQVQQSFTVSAAASVGPILYAEAGGATNGTCDSWDNACELSYALTQAASGDEIWAAAGTSKPSTAGLADPRSATFQLKNGVALYGGFAGTETSRDQRDPTVNVTILSGDLNGDDGANFTNNADNAYHVVTGSGTDATAVLDGFTVRGGNSNAVSSGAPNYGAGMLNLSGSPTVRNAVFSGNTGLSVWGAGMYNDHANPTLANVMFSGNLAYNGKGAGMADEHSSPTLTDVTFSGNTATNLGAVGGGMFNQSSSNPTLTDVTFSGNTAYTGGGGMANWYDSSPTLTNVTFSGNVVNGDYQAGDNTGYGGGMENYRSSPTLTNVTFSGNWAYWAGGMDNWNGSNPTLTNVTFSGNNWGAIYNSYSNPTITNSIFWGEIGPELRNDHSTPTVTYSDVQGGFEGVGNVNLDPVLGGLGSYGGATQTRPLLPGSAAIDGANSAACPAADQRGVTRPQGGACDMGAYEARAFSLTKTSGDNQATSVNSAFAAPIVVTVTSPDSDPVTGGHVVFTVVPDPVSGAGASVPATTGAVGADGRASVLLTANGTIGSYQVTASAIGTTDTATFSLTNVRGVVYATPGGLTTGGCTTWDEACDLAYALSIAPNGGQVWAAAGIYTPGTDAGATFALRNAVAVYGGFAGTETSLDQRDAKVNVTTLSGDLGGGVHAYHVVTGGGSNASARLDGFTVRDGDASGASPDDSGGGMLNVSGSPTLANIIFSNNSATTGGGMANTSSSPTLTNVTFSNNSATTGGGIADTSSNPRLTNVTFTDNAATDFGGGMYGTASYPTLTDVTFDHNSARLGGGMYNANTGGTTLIGLVRVTFSDNSADSGGGIYNQAVGGHILLRNVTLTGNSATTGGAMYNASSRVALYFVTFGGNSASTGGAISNTDSSSVGSIASIFWGDTGGEIVSGESDTVTLDYADIQGGCPTGATCTHLIDGAPLLGPLGSYGGSTQTVPLLPGSAAIDAFAYFMDGSGRWHTCDWLSRTDQRGVDRSPYVCDLGAYEAHRFTMTLTSGDGQSASINRKFAEPLVVTVASAYDEPVAGGRVTFASLYDAGATFVSTADQSATPGNPAFVPIAADGTASATATANGTAGVSWITATARGAYGVEFSLTNLAKATPTFSFDLSTLVGVRYGDADINLMDYVSKPSDDTGDVTFALGTDSAGCALADDGLTLTITGASASGACIVAASLAEDPTYLDAGPITQSFPIYKGLSRVVPSGKAIYGGTATLTATLTARTTGLALAGRTVEFKIGAVPNATLVGTAITDEDGVATLEDVTLPAGYTGAGTYPTAVLASFAGEDDYAGNFVGGILTVDPVTLTILPTSGQSMVYGSTPAANLAYTLSGFVGTESDTGLRAAGALGGQASCSAGVTSASPVDGYAITCTAGDLVATNYAFIVSTEPVTFAVTPAPLTVTADNKSKVYGSANPALTATLSGFANNETLPGSGVTGSASCTTTATLTSGVAGSPYSITCTLGTLSATNYSFGPFVAGSLAVTPATLTVTADGQTKVYGSANPALTATLGGFVLGQTLLTSDVTGSASCTTTATATSNVAGSPYPIACTIGTLSSTNYSFGPFVAGSLSVTPATLTVTAENKSVQYSDPLPALTYTISGFVLNETLATSGVTGAPSLSTTAATSGGNVTSGPGTYTINVVKNTLSASNYIFAFNSGTLTVTQENARAYYSGGMLFWATTTSASSATVTLTATIRDISALSGDPAYDAYQGDISNARVTFVNRDASSAALAGCSNLPVALVSAADPKVGTVSCTTTLNINGTSGATPYTIGIVVLGYYGRTDAGDNQVVEVARPYTSYFITGGGFLNESSSAGLYRADAGTKSNFGFNVKFNKGATNLQGNVNIIFRQAGHTYQIKSNALTSLGEKPSPCTKATATSPCTANFVSKANLQDITNPTAPISLGGNLVFQMSMTAYGTPTKDTIGFTLYSGSTLLFSSNWGGTKTVEQLLGGGNLSVR